MSTAEEHPTAQPSPVFKPVPSKVSFPEMEERILQLWKERDMLSQVEQARKDAAPFTLYEGPPTANGTPGIHHVLARVFKDIIPRYKTMRGYRPIRQGGWDTHGLPVELEIEKELGITSKQEIEEYGIERFNVRCRESVMRYVKEWEELTDRVGFWVDMPSAYVTFKNEYIETGWWIIKQLWDRGLLYEGYRVAPHCPRCVTTLSSHEVALGYQEDTRDPSIHVKFKVDIEKSLDSFEGRESEPGARILSRAIEGWRTGKVPIYLLAWTTTPWTLPGNTALAVSPEAEYALVEVSTKQGTENLLLASSLLEQVLTSEYRVVQRFRGRWLEGLRYEPLYDPFDAELPSGSLKRFYEGRGLTYGGSFTLHEPPDYDRGMAEHSWQVHSAEFVSMEEGTGIVHIAPAFGQDDYELGTKVELLFVQHVDLLGNITGAYPCAGKFVKDADEDIMADLEQRSLLYRREVYRHTYPFCWRCDSPLLYYAKSSWYLRTTAVQERLVSGNQEINWYPGYIKDGRFGEWLRGNVDWALSRERYWGTPIPLWRCESCDSYDCIGSVAELRERALPESGNVLDSGLLDLHRPYVDQVVVSCKTCGGAMHRIPDVMDAWFDSGAMPLAQAHVMSNGDLEELRRNGLFPADYICEAVDQTRGWFYTLHALSTFITGGPSYRNVICLGLILDENGEKMSKSRGNVVQPWDVINTRGADAVRWYMFTSAPPGNARRFSADLVGESVRKFLLTLWNVYSFFVTYANIDGFVPEAGQGIEPASELDRWIRSELEQFVAEVTRLLEEYNPTDAGRRIEDFVDVLSNWYVRRSRSRFWRPVLSGAAEGGDDQDKRSAYHTLYTCLTTLAKLLAPFTPFVAEELYQNLVCSVDNGAPDSVHLADWPQANDRLVDHDLSEAMRLAMRVASLGRAARSKAGIRVRQPLGDMDVKVRTLREFELLPLAVLQAIDELNVKTLGGSGTYSEDVASQWFDYRIRPNLPLLGPKYGPEVGAISRELAAMDPAEVALGVQSGATTQAAGHELLPEEIDVIQSDKTGWVSASEWGYTVRISTDITPELAEEGTARELVHRIQNMRRSAGFDIADRITTWYSGDEGIARVMEGRSEYIRQETLSVELRAGEPEAGAYTEEQKMDGVTVKLGVRKAQ